MKFQNTITRARKRKNYTQAELGQKIHVSRKTISSWENGRSIPNPNLIKELESVLEVKLIDDVDIKRSKLNHKSVDKQFDNYVLMFNIVATTLAVIDTGVPIFKFWIVMIQVILDILLFYTFNKKAKKVIKSEKLVFIPIFIICVLFLTALEFVTTFPTNIDSVKIVIMIIRSSIVTYGILFIILFKKLWSH